MRNTIGGIWKTIDRTVPFPKATADMGCQSMGIPFPFYYRSPESFIKSVSSAYAPCGTVNPPLA